MPQRASLQIQSSERLYYPGDYTLWLCFRCLPTVLVVAIILLLLSISPARALGIEQMSPNGVQAGQMLFQHGAGGVYSAAAIQESTVHFDISGMIARVQLEQTFHNDSGDWVEAIYAFPLPETGAVKAMEMRVGERRIVGKIKEKSLAREIYRKAKQAGKKTSLVEQQRPNLFTNRVANIAPGEQITVRLEYVQQVEFAHGEFSLRFPMTITPRYIPGAPGAEFREPGSHDSFELNPYLGWAVPTDQVADADAITPMLHPGNSANGRPLNPIEITARLDVGMPLAKVAAAYHELVMARSKNRYEISLAGGFSEMNRDFVLSWQAVTGATPQAAVFTEQVAGEHYGLLMVIPPALAGATATESIPREIIFVIDTSGSMGGVAIEQARESLGLALRQLRPVDSFNVIEFNSGHRALYPRSMPASSHHVQRALEYVRLLQAGGGTEMLPALRAALAPTRGQEPEEGHKLSQVVFITDGAVGNERQLFSEISNHLGDKRLFTIGIGSAPNSWFMRKAAQYGRGTHVHIGDLGEVADKMSQLFSQIAAPVVADIEIEWPVDVEAFPQRVSDLYRGQPVMVAVKSGTTALEGEVLVSGDIVGQAWSRQLQLVAHTGNAAGLDGSNSDRRHPGVASLWARQKISSLLDDLLVAKEADQVRTAVLDVALAHSLLSPYTSFVAVEERVVRPGDTRLTKAAVANSRPRGQSPQTYAYPRTATTAPANLFLGSLLLFCALMVVVMRREEVDHVPVTPTSELA